MGKNKNIEDTQELNAADIRRATSKLKNQTIKREALKGSTAKKTQNKTQTKAQTQNKTKAQNSPAQKRTVSKQTANKSSKTNAPATRQKPASRQTQTNTASTKTGQTNSKIRYFPQEENKSTSKPPKKINAKRKKLIRKIEGIVSFLLVCVAIITILVIFTSNQIFKIKTIKINYELPKTTQSEKQTRRYTDEQIIKASGTAIGKNLAFLDVDKTTKKLEENLPYVDVSSIDKKGFSTLIINAKQITPKYAFQFGTSYALTDETMNVLDVVIDKEKIKSHTLVSYLKISNAEIGKNVEFFDYDKNTKQENNKYKNDVLSVLNAIKASGMKKVTYISFKNIDDIYMTYDSRILIHVGNRDTITDKLKLAAKTLEVEDENNPTQTGKLNLTVEKKAYFTPD